MKFAKYLDQDLVPEWRIKYLDYKTGKKRVKAISRAISRANQTPRSNYRNTSSPFRRARTNSSLDRSYHGNNVHVGRSLRDSPTPLGADSRPESDSSGDQAVVTTPMLVPARQRSSHSMQYGSFVPTPPATLRPNPLELPGPALSPDIHKQSRLRSRTPPGQLSEGDGTLDWSSQRLDSTLMPQNAYEVGKTTPPPHRSTFSPILSRKPQILKRHASTPIGAPVPDSRPFIRRLLSHSGPLAKKETRRVDTNLETFDQVKYREKEFYDWMDGELEKVEKFYKSKEDEAGERLQVLRDQLHEMRNRRIEEIAAVKRSKQTRKTDAHTVLDAVGLEHGDFPGKRDLYDNEAPVSRDQLHAWMKPVERVLETAKSHTIGPRPGSNSKALQSMRISPAIRSQDSQSHTVEGGRDYVRRPHPDHDVPYRSAKRKLKLAMKEFYRGLELLKSYALLNRTAFRKINKKYDKAVNAHPPLRYMSEKVSKAWFVQSDVLEGHMHAVEDLYARYFEQGNHKVAVGKLRVSNKPGQYNASAFRSGLLIGTGAVFATQGLIYAYGILFHHPDRNVQLQTSYLLQIYAGYFLALYLFALFCIACSIWKVNKINYVFIFEFDPQQHLDWRQLAEFPSLLIFIFGLFLWVNFSGYVTPEIFLYFPVILIFMTAVLIFLPAPILFHRSRRWFVYSHWRLLLAGLYPVEFRDFFLGDMYCSLTYFTANIELFFCLYATHWNNPPICNSTSSRLLGFFSALPGIWRALQCIRRYYDTRVIFPHLVNCGKYVMTILFYMSLSLYRTEATSSLLALFITFATLNSIYTSIWDLAMDWSLCQPQAKKLFLRDVRGYKSVWYYYAAMIIDVVLRFNWIFYAKYTHDLQHSSIASFFIALSEVTRRGMWTLFRVENEHCANVSHFKASRDVPLPYVLHENSSSETLDRPQPVNDSLNVEAQADSSSPTLSRYHSRISAAADGDSRLPGSLRYRGAQRTLTRLFAEAHTQDFEKKRKPGAGDSDNFRNFRNDLSDDNGGGNSTDDDSDDGEDGQGGQDPRNISRSNATAQQLSSN